MISKCELVVRVRSQSVVGGSLLEATTRRVLSDVTAFI
jgi:hypothetical protein